MLTVILTIVFEIFLYFVFISTIMFFPDFTSGYDKGLESNYSPKCGLNGRKCLTVNIFKRIKKRGIRPPANKNSMNRNQ